MPSKSEEACKKFGQFRIIARKDVRELMFCYSILRYIQDKCVNVRRSPERQK